MFNYFYSTPTEIKMQTPEKTFFVSVRIPNEEKAQIWIHNQNQKQ
jgi:hypothetical protein